MKMYTIQPFRASFSCMVPDHLANIKLQLHTGRYGQIPCQHIEVYMASTHYEPPPPKKHTHTPKKEKEKGKIIHECPLGKSENVKISLKHGN